MKLAEASPAADGTTGSQSSRRDLLLRAFQQRHGGCKSSLWLYIRHTRPLVAVSAPFVYLCAFPFLLLDCAISLYQSICFPIYRIPQVARADHFQFDRRVLPYLNALEKVNCLYCSYANGLMSFVSEIAARTEQHWCPIKHASPVARPHSRYSKFLAFNDSFAYRKHIQAVRADFEDVPQKYGGINL